MKAPEKIRVIVKQPLRPARAEEIENTLQALQEYVGGRIEVVQIASDMALVCNGDGWLLGMKYNCHICGLAIAGTFLVVGTKGEKFTSAPIGPEEFTGRFIRDMEKTRTEGA